MFSAPAAACAFANGLAQVLGFLAAALGVLFGLVGCVLAEFTFQGGASVQQCVHVFEKHDREHMAIGTCISWEQPASPAQSTGIAVLCLKCLCPGGMSMCRQRGSQANLRGIPGSRDPASVRVSCIFRLLCIFFCYLAIRLQDRHLDGCKYKFQGVMRHALKKLLVILARLSITAPTDVQRAYARCLSQKMRKCSAAKRAQASTTLIAEQREDTDAALPGDCGHSQSATNT